MTIFYLTMIKIEMMCQCPRIPQHFFEEWIGISIIVHDEMPPSPANGKEYYQQYYRAERSLNLAFYLSSLRSTTPP